MQYLIQTLQIAAMIFGFGFVVFFHELGHFLAAKWAGITVEQFAVGMGQAIFAWRKGIGFKIGTTRHLFEQKIKQHLLAVRPAEASGELTSSQISRAAGELNLGLTEYRLNWLPLGGYVKMLGQDDMHANAGVDDPGAYNRKSIGARMVVVSAGVIMNVILAAIFFTILFRFIGFHVPPSIIGAIQTKSPAQLAGLRVGDQVLEMDGHVQHDFTKLQLNAALVNVGDPIPIKVKRATGEVVDLTIRPERTTGEPGAIYGLGVGPISELAGLKEKVPGEYKKPDGSAFDPKTEMLPGDTIIAVDGQPVSVEDYPVFYAHLQNSYGAPVHLTVRDKAGATHDLPAHLRFEAFFADTPFNIAGLQPRPLLSQVMDKSPAAEKDVKKGDVITGMWVDGHKVANPTADQIRIKTAETGKQKLKADFMVERDGKRIPIHGIATDFKTGPARRGVGIGIGIEEEKPIVGGLLDQSAAQKAGIPQGALILKINDQPVANWYDIHRILKQSTGPSQITFVRLDDLTGARVAGSEATLALTPSDAERQTIAGIRYGHELFLRERIFIRQTSSSLTAATWGVTETRDLLLQFYVTLHRLSQGSVGANNMMGPLGIVYAGSFFAFKGTDWLIWFLAMISANLAVVNFLPVPIVDGGLFTFLIVEKIKGKPLSPRTQLVAQYVGLAMILTVLVLVTYQDIQRMF